METGFRLATNGHIQVEDGSGGQQSQQHKQAANKSVVAAADKHANSLCSGRLNSVVPHFKR